MTLASAALTIAVLLIPGVAFIWGYERWNEVYARRARDWPFRLAAIAAVYLAVASGTIYWLASSYWADLAGLRPVPKWLAFVPVAYVVGAAAFGFALGALVRLVSAWGHWLARFSWLNRIERWLVGWTRSGRGAPNAWAYLFRSESEGIVRCRLKSGRWVGGYYGIGSYASAQGPKRDLLISRAVPFGEDGAPIAPCGGTADSGGLERRISLLVKWDDIETLEFTATDGGQQEAAQ